MMGDPFPEPASSPGPRRHAGRWLGPVLVTTGTQPAGAPLIDGCRVDADGAGHGGYAIRRPGWGDRPGPTLVIAWRNAQVPYSARTRLRVWRWRAARRLAWPAVAALLRLVNGRPAPRCEGCSMPITGLPIYGGEDAGELCRWCGPSEADGADLRIVG